MIFLLGIILLVAAAIFVLSALVQFIWYIILLIFDR